MKFKIRISLLPFLLFFLLLFISGCWDLAEIDRRSFATTIGIDVTPEQMVLLSVQIPFPQKMLPPGTVSGGAEQGKEFNTISITAKTVHTAFNELQTKTYRNLVIQQNKSVIIGEAAAQQGVKPLMDFLLRSPKAPPQSLVFIAHVQTAHEILTFSPKQKTLPGEQFIQVAQSDEKYDRTYFIPIWLFEQKLTHETKDTYAPLITFDEADGQFIIAGLGVFNGDRLAGELNMEETQFFGLIKSLTRAGQMTFEFSERNMVSLNDVTAKTRIKVETSAGLPHFNIKTNIKGAIGELPGGESEITPALLGRLEQAIAKEIESKMAAVIKRLQAFNSDCINFGEELRVQHQGIWETINWKKVFPGIPFTVRVKVAIDRNGVTQK